jgi:hypothetical protein
MPFVIAAHAKKLHRCPQRKLQVTADARKWIVALMATRGAPNKAQKKFDFFPAEPLWLRFFRLTAASSSFSSVLTTLGIEQTQPASNRVRQAPMRLAERRGDSLQLHFKDRASTLAFSTKAALRFHAASNSDQTTKNRLSKSRSRFVRMQIQLLKMSRSRLIPRS